MARIALSFYPLMWAKHNIFRFVSKMDLADSPENLVKQARMLRMSSNVKWAAMYVFLPQSVLVRIQLTCCRTILLLPVVLIGVTLLASSERTPLTGR